jgi:hypothetical protein
MKDNAIVGDIGRTRLARAVLDAHVAHLHLTRWVGHTELTRTQAEYRGVGVGAPTRRIYTATDVPFLTT